VRRVRTGGAGEGAGPVGAHLAKLTVVAQNVRLMPYATRMASPQTPVTEFTWKSTWTVPSTADVVWHLRMSSAHLLCASELETVQTHSIGSFVASSRRPVVVPKEYSWHWRRSLCLSVPLHFPPLGQDSG
jgi:hypothetical protein